MITLLFSSEFNFWLTSLYNLYVKTNVTGTLACSSKYCSNHCVYKFIATASGPCSSSPCENGGTCVNVGTTDFFCNCPEDYDDGETCSECNCFIKSIVLTFKLWNFDIIVEFF